MFLIRANYFDGLFYQCQYLIQNYFKKKSLDVKNIYEIIHIYVIPWAIMNESSIGTPTIIIMEDGSERRLLMMDLQTKCDHDVLNRERRVFQQDGSECYSCYRKRVDSQDYQILFFIREICQEEGISEASSRVFELYRKLRQENLVLSDSLFDDESRRIIPEFNERFFSRVPTIPIPVWVNNQMQWSFIIDRKHVMVRMDIQGFISEYNEANEYDKLKLYRECLERIQGAGNYRKKLIEGIK